TAASSSSSSGMPECMSAADCPPTSTACIVPTCTGGQCLTKVAPDGSMCMNSGGKVCTGAVCVACIADGDCSPNNTCTPDHTCIGQCTNMLKDGNETDVDCGGGSCAPCATGKSCAVDNDCVSTDACQGGACVSCAPMYGKACGS